MIGIESIRSGWNQYTVKGILCVLCGIRQPPMSEMIDWICFDCAEGWFRRKRFWTAASLSLVLYVCGLPSVQAQDRLPDTTADMRRLNPEMPPPLQIDPRRVEAAGIRIWRGRHVDLYSDLRDGDTLAQLVEAFDQAIPLWCQYFDVPLRQTEDYRISGIVIADRNQTEAFRRAGLLPDDLPDFLAGYNRGHEFWIYLQPGDYYTRHLMLHEGTHAFMQWFLGGNGPAWYSEGMAERLGLHRWADGRLELPWRVRSADECAYWGRVKRIRTERDAGRTLQLDQVLAIPPISFRDVAAYAWSWAAVEFFSDHPLSAERFARLTSQADDSTERFNRRFRDGFSAAEWRRLNQDWQVMIAEIDYGYQPGHAAMQPARMAGENGFAIRADRGWQTTLAVRSSEVVEIEAEGQVQVAREAGHRLEATADGITIHYWRGQPLGRLQVGILADDGGTDTLLAPVTTGARARWTVPANGTLCFRINDSAARLDDNRGELTVRVKKIVE